MTSTPLLDVALLIATVFDLGRGATASWVHGVPDRTAALWQWMGRLTLVLGIWFVAGPLWTMRTPRRAAD
ncbi:MAG TPA: hypothetical protein VGX25_10455 [Actinophytocola sp.]|uniref:hypothetical protein n=1 Tax=Actinophytocola sp. TaxID=1872138 RepID=UPI002DDD41D3|nr:hypothetical protein [Actinophytocola sp.]HEV2779806.1 hypothetical protein [Actinophytocola sp.]